MTYNFSTRSKDNLFNVHPKLVTLAYRVLRHGLFDFGVTCGERPKEEQDKAVFEGRSKVEFPNSKHNIAKGVRDVAEAMDIILYINGKGTYKERDKPSYYMALGVFLGIASEMGIRIRCGGDWDRDFSVTDQNFHDLPHIEYLGEI